MALPYSFSTQVSTGGTINASALTSTRIDTTGSNSIVFRVALGAVVTGTVTFLVQSSNDNSTWADYGSVVQALTTTTDDNKVVSFTIANNFGSRRDFRIVATNATASAIVIRNIIASAYELKSAPAVITGQFNFNIG